MTDDRHQAARDAALSAHWAVEREVLKLAEVEGAPITEASMFPGSISITRYAEPLAGIRAAVMVEADAARVKREYAKRAREAQLTWLQIGQVIKGDLPGSEDLDGYNLAVAAYEYFAGPPDIWHQPVFTWTCPACEQYVSDRGPYEGNPLDNEHGHGEGCTRMAAEVAAWDARWADE
jgi:hypothetical protein